MQLRLVFACVLLAVGCARTTSQPMAQSGGQGGAGAQPSEVGSGGSASLGAGIGGTSGGAGGAVASGGNGGSAAIGGTCNRDGDPCMGGAGRCCRGACSADCYPDPWPAPLSCDVLGVAACLTDPRCRTIDGWLDDDDDAGMTLEPVACTQLERVCANAVTCARANEAAPEYQFPSTCVPTSWIACEEP